MNTCPKLSKIDMLNYELQLVGCPESAEDFEDSLYLCDMLLEVVKRFQESLLRKRKKKNKKENRFLNEVVKVTMCY